jgi:Transposase IS116/IS110/IS902 family
MVATLGDAKSFKNARQVPAWLGMVPRHEGTGGNVKIMVWTPPFSTGIEVPKWRCRPTT